MTTLACRCCRLSYDTDQTTVAGQPVAQWWSDVRDSKCRGCQPHHTPCHLVMRPRLGGYHQNGPDTERLAAESIKERSGRLRQQALALLDQHPDGLTDDEGGALMGGDRLDFGRRRNELCTAGLVIDSGRRRPSHRGRPAAVWVRTTPIAGDASTERKS